MIYKIWDYIVNILSKIKLNWLENLSLYELLNIYITGILKGAFSYRAGAIAFSFFMALFPFTEANAGISGALAKGEIYKPTIQGVLIYFNTVNIDETLKLANTNGGQNLYPKTDNGIGLVAEFKDTEGNRIALFESKK